VLSGILENCDASAKAEVGPTFRFLTSVAEPYCYGYSSGSETLFITPLTLFTEEARWKVGVIYPGKERVSLYI
jgi:hypothetical protein